MRNRVLHDALRDFALEAAALLTDELREGAEIEFDVVDEGDRRGAVLYRYQPRTAAYISSRWVRLRELPSCGPACAELGVGAATWLRVNGLRGEQAEPALMAMLERLYEDATSFGFPEERFERVYLEVESTLYRDAVRDRVIAPLDGAWMEAERVDLGGGLSLVRGDCLDAPAEAVYPEGGDGAAVLMCVLDRDTAADERLSAAEAAERFAGLVTALRLWKAGAVSLGAPGWRRSDGGRWAPMPLGASGRGRGVGWTLREGEERPLRDFVATICAAGPAGGMAWALERFEMGCERRRDSEALSDYLLALRALLDAGSEAGQASLAPRLAALCAEENARLAVQRRVDDAFALERLAMGVRGASARSPEDPPGDLVAEIEGHLRALLRDVLCGYLEPDLKSVADDILLETQPESIEIEARDLREESPAPAPTPEPVAAPQPYLDFDPAPAAAPAPRPEPAVAPPKPRAPAALLEEEDVDTSEIEALGGPVAEQQQLDGVTASEDWAPDEPEDYSAPV